MNRTVKMLAVLLVAAFSYTMPSHACWWNYIDDMYSYDEDSGCDDGGYDYYDDSGCDDYSYDLGGYDYYYGYDDWYDDNSGYNDYAWDITLDEVEITGSSSNDSFWGSGIFIEQDLGMDDSGSYSGTDSPQQTDSQSDTGQNGSGSGEPNAPNSQSAGAYHPNNNPTTTETTYHQPKANEVLFKDNLPAQTLKMQCKMDCVPTVMATLIALSGSDYTASEIRENIEYNYLISKPERYDLCTKGVQPEDLEKVMNDAFFFKTSVGELVENINGGHPCAAVIDNEIGRHMIAIVGYFNDDDGEVHAYQCINPGKEGDKYETHYDYEFKNHLDKIYVKYNVK